MVSGMEPATVIPTTVSTPPTPSAKLTISFPATQTTPIAPALRISKERKSKTKFGTYQIKKQTAIVYNFY